jgi:hypothetical protein
MFNDAHVWVTMREWDFDTCLTQGFGHSDCHIALELKPGTLSRTAKARLKLPKRNVFEEGAPDAKVAKTCECRIHGGASGACRSDARDTKLGAAEDGDRTGWDFPPRAQATKNPQIDARTNESGKERP